MLVGCLVAIAAIGVLMVYSATRAGGAATTAYDASFLKNQAMFVVLGFVVMVVTAVIDYHRVRDFAPLAYLGGVGLLALVVSPLGSNQQGHPGVVRPRRRSSSSRRSSPSWR